GVAQDEATPLHATGAHDDRTGRPGHGDRRLVRHDGGARLRRPLVAGDALPPRTPPAPARPPRGPGHRRPGGDPPRRRPAHRRPGRDRTARGRRLPHPLRRLGPRHPAQHPGREPDRDGQTRTRPQTLTPLHATSRVLTTYAHTSCFPHPRPRLPVSPPTSTPPGFHPYGGAGGPKAR